MHEHGHAISHAHHHSHHPEHTTLVHRVLKDPVRDWFGAGLMAVLIVVGYKQMLPGPLSDGALVCAAIIGIFPLFKNALFASIAQRTVRLELVPCLALVVGLFSGLFFETALAALLLLIGSFMRLNFSWKEH
jgi:cation transport ATPase